jgi:hypothetical protein
LVNVDPIYALRFILLGILVLLVYLTVPGCTTLPAAGAIPVALPDRPNLPTIQSVELACTLPDVRERLVLRETLLKDYAQQLELVIEKLTTRK